MGSLPQPPGTRDLCRRRAQTRLRFRPDHAELTAKRKPPRAAESAARSEPGFLCRPEHTTLAGMIVTQYGRPLGGLQAGNFEEQGAGLSSHVSSALDQLRGFYGLGNPGSPAASNASQSTGVTTSDTVQECVGAA